MQAGRVVIWVSKLMQAGVTMILNRTAACASTPLAVKPKVTGQARILTALSAQAMTWS